MRIGFISQYYAPEPGAAAHPATVAEALARQGTSVQVLTGYPSYPDGVLYPGFRQRWRSRELRNGVEVTRVPYFLSHDSSGARRAASMLTFGLSSSLHRRVVKDVDVSVVYASPMTSTMAAMATTSRPFIMYIQDLWPDSVLASGMLGARPALERGVERILDRACRLAYQRADAIAVISPGMKDTLVARGVPPRKITIVPNWVDESIFQPTEPDPELRQAFASHELTVMYAGGVGELQGLEHAVEAIEMLGETSGVHLAILGEGVAKAKLQQQVHARGLQKRVSFWPGRSLQEMPFALAAADAQLIPLRDRPLFYGTVPSKFQAALASGQPVIVSAPGDAARLAEEARAGVASPPESAIALADALLTMKRAGARERALMGERGATYYRQNLSEQAGAAALVQLARELA